VTAFLLAWEVFAMDVHLPSQVKQGHLMRVEIKPFASGTSVVFGGNAAPVFERTGGGLALVPVPVVQAPGPNEITIRDAEGKELGRRKVEILDAQYPTQDIRATRAMKALKPLPDEMATMGALHKTVSPVAFWTEPFAAPTPHCANSSFGVQRLHNGKPTGNYHRGLDLRSPRGTPVRATADGVVRVARMFRVHGGAIGIDHGQGVTSHYLHLSRLAAKQGTKVKKGQVVGYVGATGFATGPHLHWGVYVHGTPTDPRQLAPSVKSCPVQ
jgi:murein DD-endopeptidase MepM/ murein hydrolase activator NlpD